jgi:DNA-binding transcriptional regulator YiaG
LRDEVISLKNDNHKLRTQIDLRKEKTAILKAFEFTNENIERVRRMACGMSKEQIAKCFNMTLATYLNREEELPALKQAYEVGAGEFMEESISILKKRIREGCLKSLLFFLSTKMNFKNNVDNGMQITIAQEFLNKPLKIVNGDGNYEADLLEKYKEKILSVSIKQNNSTNLDE